MGDLRPGLDHVFLRVGHVIERYGQRIEVIAHIDACMRAAVDIFYRGTFTVEIGRHVSVAVSHSQRRLEIILVARGGIHLESARRSGPGGAVPRQIFQIFLREKSRPEICLIEAAVRTDLEGEFSVVGGDSDDFSFGYLHAASSAEVRGKSNAQQYISFIRK